jgi:hypothetical protein
MSSGLIQLAILGIQDLSLQSSIALDVNSYFKIVYMRHTNFALETLIQPINNLCFGRKVTTTINKIGDLLSSMYLCIEIPKLYVKDGYAAWVKRLGHAIIKSIELTIGGTRFDKQYDITFDILWELNRKNDNEVGYSKMIGNIPNLTSLNSEPKESYTLYIPLQFWFNKYYGSSFPINFINYTQMYINVTLQELEKLIIRTRGAIIPDLKIINAYFLSTYVFLDMCERTKFAVSGHEYLIEQVQANNNYDLVTDYYVPFDISNFQYSVKELFWCTRNGNYLCGKPFIYYADSFVNDTMDEYYNRFGSEYDGKFKPWSLIEASKIIVLDSVSVGTEPDNGGCWIEVCPDSQKAVGTFYVINCSCEEVYVNPESLKLNDYSQCGESTMKCEGITDKIKATIIINKEGKIKIKYLETDLTIQDISISTDDMIDTRVSNCMDVILNQFSNYGLYIDGSGNLVKDARITFSGNERVMKLSNNYFNYMQPISYHDNVPKNGILSYSFAIHPANFEPSGSANFSKLDKAELQVWFNNDKRFKYCYLDCNSDLNRFYIYAINNNIMRVFGGFCGIQCDN